MGYFNTSGKWQNTTPSHATTSWAMGSDAYRWAHGRAGTETGMPNEEAYDWSSGYGGTGRTDITFGEGKGLLGATTRGSLFKVHDSWGTGKDYYMGFTPMGQRMLGSESRGFNTGKTKDSKSLKAAKDHYLANYFGEDDRIAGPEQYVGPSLTGGFKAEGETYADRKNRIMRLPQWKGSENARDLYLTANKYSTENKDVTGSGYDKFGGADNTGMYKPYSGSGNELDHVKLTPFKAADKSELKQLLSTEFGKSQITDDLIEPYVDSDEYDELAEIETDRKTIYGDLYEKDSSEYGFDRTREELDDLINYLKPTGTDSLGMPTGNVFKGGIKRGATDIASTPWDETQMVDWDATLGGGTFRDAYEDAIRNYYKHEVGRDIGDDSSKWGSVIRDYLDTEIPDYEEVLGDQKVIKDMYSKISGFEGDIVDAEQAQSEAASGTRASLLENLTARNRRQYTGGFAGMGQSPALASKKHQLLQDAKIGLLGTKGEVGALRDQIGIEEGNIEDALRIEENMLTGIYGNWQDLQEKFAAQGGTAGQFAKPTSDWAADLWTNVAAGYGL